MNDLVEPGREPSYEYCLMIERQRDAIAERAEKQKEYKKMQLEQQEKLERERRESHEQVRLTLIKREEEATQSHVSPWPVQRIITSKWNVR